MSAENPPVVRFRNLFGSSIAASLLGLGFSALSTLATARVLGAAGRGEVAVLTAIASYSVVALSLSLESGILHLGRRFSSVERLLSRIRALLVLLTLTNIIALSILASALAGRSLDPLTVLLFGVGYGVPVAVPALTAIERLRGRHHSAVWWPSLVLTAQQLSGLVGLAIQATLNNYVGGSSIGGLLATLAFFVYARPRSCPGLEVDPKLSIRELVNYSLTGHVGVILFLLCGRLPVVLAGIYLGNSQAGVYSVAVALAEVGLLPSQSQLGYVLAMATSQPEDFSTLKRQLKLAALLTTGMVALLIVASIWAPLLLGRDFSEASRILLALGPGVVLLSLWRIGSYDLAARGLGHLRTTSAAWGGLAAVVGGLAAVHFGGVESLAWSSSITYLVMFIALGWGYRRRTVRL